MRSPEDLQVPKRSIRGAKQFLTYVIDCDGWLRDTDWVTVPQKLVVQVHMAGFVTGDLNADGEVIACRITALGRAFLRWGYARAYRE